MDDNKLIRMNNFTCKFSMGDVEFDDRLVSNFIDDVMNNRILLSYYADEKEDYEGIFCKIRLQKCKGKLLFTVYGYDKQPIKEVYYDILSISEVILPEYDKELDDTVKYVLTLDYTKKDITYFRNGVKDNNVSIKKG